MSRAQVDKLVDRAKQLGAGGLVWMRVVDGGALECQVLKFLSEAEQLGIVDTLGAEPGDLLLVAAGPRRAGRPRARHVAGRARPPAGARGRAAVPVGRRLPAVRGARRRRPPDPGPPPVHDAPPRRPRAPRARHGRGSARRCGRWPTTSCSTAGSSARARVRIHRPDLQQRIFSLLGISEEEAQSRFGFLLDAFRYGAPPHAGFAFGIDRLTAILAGEDNIREVIAFPKTQSGADPLTGAPTAIDPPSSRSSASASSPNPRSSDPHPVALDRASANSRASPAPTQGRGRRGRLGRERPAQIRSAGRGRLRQGGAIGRVRVGRPHACV